MIRTISQTNVVNACFDEIMNHILSGDWPVGSKIPSENELTLQLGISRNSLRQALNRFNALGILESRHGDGTYVRSVDMTFYLKNIFPMLLLSHYDALNVYQLQRAVQNESASIACRLITENQIHELERQLTIMREMDARNDQKGYLEADLRFHEVITEVTRNPVLISIEECISKLMRGALYEACETSRRGERILAHQKILEALKRRDHVGVTSWMSVHMNDVITQLEQSVHSHHDSGSVKES